MAGTWVVTGLVCLALGMIIGAVIMAGIVHTNRKKERAAHYKRLAALYSRLDRINRRRLILAVIIEYLRQNGCLSDDAVETVDRMMREK